MVTETVLVTLVAYRIWRLLFVDDLPPLADLRDTLWDAVEARWGPRWADGIGCPWCSGTWTALAVAGVWHATLGLTQPVVVGVAAAAGVGLLAGWNGD